MPPAERAILVTGCSTGIGYTCALGMKARGWRVFATARRPDDLAMLDGLGLEAVALDYADPASVAACAGTVLERTGGRIDALFNNGAYGQPGFVEDLSVATLRRQFEANVFGWHDLTVRLIPAMRAQGHGRIVQCSSVLGLVAMKYRGAYNASKFAVEGLTDTLRLELAGSGIHVSTIEPGPIRSRFAANALAALRREIDIDASLHRDLYRRRIAALEAEAAGLPPREAPGEARRRTGPLPRYRLGPEAVLDALVHAVESRRPRPHYHVTMATRFMAAMRRLLPARILHGLAGRLS